MELVKGVPITEYCDENQLAARRAAGAVRRRSATPCSTRIRKGIIHRDLKPSNVLVTLHDGEPVPKVIDFGVAKATSQQLTEKTLFTGLRPDDRHAGLHEPRAGRDERPGHRHAQRHLLARRAALRAAHRHDAVRRASGCAKRGYAEMQRIIREEEPPRPSTRLSTLGDDADRRRPATAAPSPRSSASCSRGDLDWIVMKALEKDRSRRYETANAFADDIQRFLNHEAIVARPPRPPIASKNSSQRNWAAVAAGRGHCRRACSRHRHQHLAGHPRGWASETWPTSAKQAIAEAAKQRGRTAARHGGKGEASRGPAAAARRAAKTGSRSRPQLAERELREAAEQKRQDIERQSEQIAGLNATASIGRRAAAPHRSTRLR